MKYQADWALTESRIKADGTTNIIKNALLFNSSPPGQLGSINEEKAKGIMESRQARDQEKRHGKTEISEGWWTGKQGRVQGNL